LTIDWAEEGSPVVIDVTNALTPRVQLFNPLSVVSRDGFEMRVSVKVVIRVRPDQAPLMVAKIGSIENLIDHVIHPMIDSSFRNQASSTQAMNFLQDRALEQVKAEERAREELERWAPAIHTARPPKVSSTTLFSMVEPWPRNAAVAYARPIPAVKDGRSRSKVRDTWPLNWGPAESAGSCPTMMAPAISLVLFGSTKLTAVPFGKRRY